MYRLDIKHTFYSTPLRWGTDYNYNRLILSILSIPHLLARHKITTGIDCYSPWTKNEFKGFNFWWGGFLRGAAFRTLT